MKNRKLRRFLSSILIAAACFCFVPEIAVAQDNWAADDDSFEARKIERYQQLVDQSPEKSYAFNQLMDTVGKGAQYQQLLNTYEKKVANKPDNFNLRMILGHMYQHGGRTNEAIESYKKAVEIKKTPLVYMAIAAAEADNKNFDPAIENYQAAAALNPNKEQKQEIWRALAEIAIYRRDMVQAEKCFEELIKIEPNSLFVRRELSQIYSENRLYNEARGVLEKASKISGASASDKDQIEFDIAELYELENNDDEALKRYEALSDRLSPSHWMQRELTARIIDIQRRHGNIAGLAETLEKKWKSPNYQQHLELADLYDETGNADKALAHIQKAIASSPKLPEAHEKLVRYYRSHGMIDKMFEAKRAQIKAVPDNPEYLFELYEAYYQQQKKQQSLSVLDEIQKKFPNDFDVQNRVATLYQMNGRGQKALQFYENWVKNHPSDLQGLEILGDQYDNLGQKKRALDTWKRIENLKMDKATKLETLARIYDEHGYADEAELLYQKAVASSPSDCQMHQLYADILTRNGKQTDAIEAWKKLAATCKTAPIRTVAARQLASLYTARGEQKEAINQYRGKCESNPDNLDNILMFASIANALNMPREAILTVDAYTQKHPNESQALNALNLLYANAGNLDYARKTLERVATISETDKREALIAMAEFDVQAGDLDAAQEHLSEALRLNANDAETHEKLGDILVSRRQYDEASNNYATAYQIDNRNYTVAFKNATCLSILGKTKEADDLYVQIVMKSTDEVLSLKAARRAIDDHAWLGTLDTLAATLLPLQRSTQRKEMYLEILLSIVDAQAQPHVLALLTRDAAHALSARHALRELGEKYASLIIESLLSKDAAIAARALELSEWMTSSSVVNILGRIIYQAGPGQDEQERQIKAVRAIARAQLPSAVSVLESEINANSRALREYVIWGLGLIPSKAASEVLVSALDARIDTVRALAVIGLGRQNAKLDKVHELLKNDPSNVVRDAAAWMLAYHRYEKAYADIRNFFDDENLKPHQLWAIARIDESGSAPIVVKSLWCSANRTMAANLIRSEQTDFDITTITLAENQGRMLKDAKSHYQSNFDIDIMLEHFSMLALKDSGSPASWINAHRNDFTVTAQKIAKDVIHAEDNSNACSQQMLRDLVMPSGLVQFDAADAQQRPVLAETARLIAPQLMTWVARTDSHDEKSIAGLSLQTLALTDSSDALAQASKIAKSDADMAIRLDAVEAIAKIQTAESRKILRELASDTHYLVRAAAVSHLDPANPDDLAVLKKAANDDYLIVSQTASERIKK